MTKDEKFTFPREESAKGKKEKRKKTLAEFKNYFFPSNLCIESENCALAYINFHSRKIIFLNYTTTFKVKMDQYRCFLKKKKNKFKTFKNINNHFHNDNNPLVTFENDS